MNEVVDLSQVAGKNIEDLTIKELKAIASQAGRKAYENAKKRGSPVTKFQDNQIVWVYPDGHTEPLRKTEITEQVQ